MKLHVHSVKLIKNSYQNFKGLKFESKGSKGKDYFFKPLG
jgi:hypothetical protein